MFLCIAVGVMVLFAQPAMAAKDTLTTTANDSGNGSTPDGKGDNWIYAYALSCNSSLSDTLDLDLMITNTKDPSGQFYNISFSATGETGLLHATLPSSFDLYDTGSSVKKYIPITTDSLAPGDYDIKIHINTPPGALTEPNPKDIQVKIHVNECTGSEPSCFFTDSNGDFLAGCDGELVSENTGGTFMLVNKKNGTIVATNPGQFYYNYIWTNDGDGVDVQVNLNNWVNLVPHGANAVHAYTFGPSGFTQNVEAFDMVNNDGTPCGPSGPCTINVGAGETLWVTWHLEYEWVGQTKDAGTSCLEAKEPIGAGARLVNANNELQEVAGNCSASATGYNKR